MKRELVETFGNSQKLIAFWKMTAIIHKVLKMAIHQKKSGKANSMLLLIHNKGEIE